MIRILYYCFKHQLFTKCSKKTRPYTSLDFVLFWTPFLKCLAFLDKTITLLKVQKVRPIGLRRHCPESDFNQKELYSVNQYYHLLSQLQHIIKVKMAKG